MKSIDLQSGYNVTAKKSEANPCLAIVNIDGDIFCWSKKDCEEIAKALNQIAAELREYV
jgi:hypothetical protein